jgi:NTE family protein
MANQNIPDKQRALVLQGGGALGAYDAGVFQAIYEKFHENKPLFDIIAGTSSGAMNAAILVSHVAENNNSWKGSAGKLNDFWNYVSRAPGNGKIGIPQGEGIPGFSNWWEYWHSASSSIASEEAARRYYSAKEFLYTGVPRVFFPLLPPRTDNRFFDNFSIPNNMWYTYSNQSITQR